MKTMPKGTYKLLSTISNGHYTTLNKDDIVEIVKWKPVDKCYDGYCPKTRAKKCHGMVYLKGNNQDWCTVDINGKSVFELVEMKSKPKKAIPFHKKKKLRMIIMDTGDLT